VVGVGGVVSAAGTAEVVVADVVAAVVGAPLAVALVRPPRLFPAGVVTGDDAVAPVGRGEVAGAFGRIMNAKTGGWVVSFIRSMNRSYTRKRYLASSVRWRNCTVGGVATMMSIASFASDTTIP
jgi:hypothetical protein